MCRDTLICLCLLAYFNSLCSFRIVNGSVDSWSFNKPTVIFDPPEAKGIIEEERKRIYFSIKESNNTSAVQGEARDVTLSVGVYIEAERPNIVEVLENATSVLCLKSGETVKNHSFDIKGVFLGYSNIYVRLHPFEGECPNTNVQNYQHANDWYEHPNIRNGSSYVVYSYEYLVSIAPAPSLFLDIFTAIMALIVGINYVNLGCQLDLSSIWQVMKKPIGPCIGFICQFLFMPLASYGIGYLIFEDTNLRLGLFTLGCSPGGSMSNFWTLLFNGDLNLSVTMTFISTIAALGMMPLWIFTLGTHLFQDGKVTLPYLNLAGSLVMLTLPVGVGIIIRRYKSKWAQFSEKLIRPFTIFCIVVGITMGCYASRYLFIMITWKIVAAGLVVAWGGYSFGALAAFIAGLTRPQIIAVAIETAFQNGPVAFVMLILSLPQPDASLTAVPVLAQLLITGLPMWVIFATLRIIKCIKKCQTTDEEKKVLPEALETKSVEKMTLEKETNL